MKRASSIGLHRGMQTKPILISGALVASFVASIPIAFAAPPPCKKWMNGLSACEALGVDGSNGDCAPEGQQNETVNYWLHAATADKACEQYVRRSKPALLNYSFPKKVRACVWSSTDLSDKTCYSVIQALDHPPNKTSAACVYDINLDGKINWDDSTQIGLKVDYNDNITPDAHCFCTAEGPYTYISWNSEGESPSKLHLANVKHHFPPGFKKTVLDTNSGGTDVYKSDAIDKYTGVSFDSQPDPLQKDDWELLNAAEIDHIIPRVDSKGCLCGDVTPSNAAVVSRELNWTMSNSSPKYNFDRWKMFEKYVTCPRGVDLTYEGTRQPLPSFAPLEHHQVDECLLDVDFDIEPIKREAPEASVGTGGCSAGGGAGLLLGIIGLVLRRRKRTTR